jgi:hypothetical protein
MFRQARIARESLAVIIAGMPLGALAQSSAVFRCDQLAAFYDRYTGNVILSEGRSRPTGYLERELGVQECRRGNQAAGVRLLEEAIRKTGSQVPAG